MTYTRAVVGEYVKPKHVNCFVADVSWTENDGDHEQKHTYRWDEADIVPFANFWELAGDTDGPDGILELEGWERWADRWPNQYESSTPCTPESLQFFWCDHAGNRKEVLLG